MPQVSPFLNNKENNSVSEIEKIKKLIATATSPKQKAMYQKLLEEIEAKKPLVANKPKTIELENKKSPVVDKSKLLAAPPKRVVINKPQTQPKIEVENTQPLEEDNDPMFQAIGVIKGNVTINEEKSVVNIRGAEYPLLYIPSHKRRRAYDALKKEIESTGNTTHRLIVYPKITHFPGRDNPHAIAWQLVGFIGSEKQDKSELDNLKDFEFILRGMWQFIPVCQTPCISVFKNFSKERLDWIKTIEDWKKVKFMKVSHLPLLWRDSPVKPFRFNPKLEKEQQGKAIFVSLKAKFLPGRDVFAFVQQLSKASEQPPKFFKASKKLKAEVLKAKTAG